VRQFIVAAALHWSEKRVLPVQSFPRNGGRGAASLIPPHGGFRHLKDFHVARLVYDVTVRFCDRDVDRRSRAHDQMVQTARSGVQNIAEGS